MIAQKENTQIEAMAFLIFLCFFCSMTISNGK